MIYLTSDHRGFDLKEKLKSYLEKKDIKYIDLGPFAVDPGDDYPIYARKLGEAVVASNGRGIAACRSGVGMAMALNKIDGIRAAELYTVEEAKLSRSDDDTNVLVLGSDVFDSKKGFRILDAWLNTKFSGAERHIRRLDEIKKYEEEN
jgi:ribose 5-phosphate isomerase B